MATRISYSGNGVWLAEALSTNGVWMSQGTYYTTAAAAAACARAAERGWA